MPRSDRRFAARFNPSYHSPYNRAARRAYTGGWFRLAGRVAGGAGAVAAAGLANLFAEVPRLQSDPRVMSGYETLGRKGAHSRSGSAMSIGAASNAGVSKDPTAYTQFAVVRRKSGRRPTKVRRTIKACEGLLTSLVTRFQRAQAFGAAEGQFKLNFHPAATTGQRSVYPVYIFDLSGVINQKRADTGSVNCPTVGQRLTRRYDTGVLTDYANCYQFRPNWVEGPSAGSVTGLAPDGATACYSWVYERRPRMLTQNGKATLDWADIRLMIYGATTRPSKVHCKIIRFIDPEMTPAAYFGDNSQTAVPVAGDEDPSLDTSAAAADGDRIRRWNELWLGQVDQLVAGPMCKRDAFSKTPPYKVMWSQTCEFSPTLGTSESDPRGHMRQVKLFKNFNKVFSFQDAYNSSSAGLTVAGTSRIGVNAVNENDPNVWDTPSNWDLVQDTNTNTECFAAKTSRLYLMVSAEVPTNGAFSPTTSPSFDMIIRRKHSVLAQS